MRYFARGMIPHSGRAVSQARKNKKAADNVFRGLSVSDSRENLSVVAGRASGENSSVGHRDLSLADPIRFRFLGSNTADLYLVANFQ